MKRLIPAFFVLCLGVIFPVRAYAQAASNPHVKVAAKSAAPAGATFDYGAMINDFGFPIMMDLQSVIDDYLIYKEQIDITPGQLAMLKKLRDEYQTEVIRLNSALDIATLKLSNVLYEDKIDVKEVQSLSAEIGRLEGEIRAENIETFIGARNILNGEQIKKAESQGIKFYPFEYLGYRRLFR